MKVMFEDLSKELAKERARSHKLNQEVLSLKHTVGRLQTMVEPLPGLDTTRLHSSEDSSFLDRVQDEALIGTGFGF